MSAQEFERKGDTSEPHVETLDRWNVGKPKAPLPPAFYVSVASKELSLAVSLLFATLAR